MGIHREPRDDTLGGMLLAHPLRARHTLHACTVPLLALLSACPDPATAHSSRPGFDAGSSQRATPPSAASGTDAAQAEPSQPDAAAKLPNREPPRPQAGPKLDAMPAQGIGPEEDGGRDDVAAQPANDPHDSVHVPRIFPPELTGVL